IGSIDRNLLGEDLGSLSIKELDYLEKQLDMSLREIRSTRVCISITQQMLDQLTDLQRRVCKFKKIFIEFFRHQPNFAAHQQEQLLCEANKGLRRRVRCLILYDASRYLDSYNACCEGKKLTTTDGECSWRRAAMLMEDKYGKTVPIQQLSSNMVMDYSTNWSVNPLHRLGILSEYISSHPQAQFLVFQYQTKDAVVHKSHLLHDFCRYQPDQMPGTSVSTYMPAWLE
ncbi:hypothetical protein BHE74_00058503, partial [Ensete ventricosum]